MQVTTIEGIVKNGQIQLTEDFKLPEMATVYVVIPKSAPVKRIMSPRLVDESKSTVFKREIIEISDDEV